MYTGSEPLTRKQTVKRVRQKQQREIHLHHPRLSNSQCVLPVPRSTDSGSGLPNTECDATFRPHAAEAAALHAKSKGDAPHQKVRFEQ